MLLSIGSDTNILNINIFSSFKIKMNEIIFNIFGYVKNDKFTKINLTFRNRLILWSEIKSENFSAFY